MRSQKPQMSASVFALVLFALAFLQLCSAENKLGTVMGEMIVTNGRSLVVRMQNPNMQWRIASRTRDSSEWMDLVETNVTASAGGRMVTVHLAQQLATLQCEEWGVKTREVRRGRCTLQSSTTSGWEDVFFEYRVVSWRGSADSAGNPLWTPHTCKLYQENPHDGTPMEVGIVTYTEEETKGVERSRAFFILEFRATGTAGDGIAWLPAALRFTGITLDDVAQQRWLERASSSMAERWGYPILLVGMLYGALLLLVKVAHIQKSLAVKPRQA